LPWGSPSDSLGGLVLETVRALTKCDALHIEGRVVHVIC
jgi:hypothetical protein